MKQKNELPNNASANEAGNDPRHARRIYTYHFEELILRINMYEQDRPGILNIGDIPSAAMLSWLVELDEEFGLESLALDIEDVITALLNEMSQSEYLTRHGLGNRAAQVEQLMKLTRMLRFTAAHVMPYVAA